MANKKAKGKRAKTRKMFTAELENRGINRFFQEFELGDKIVIDLDSSVHSGLPFRRFQGKPGTVVEKRGRCWMVSIQDGNKAKKVIVNAAHVKRQHVEKKAAPAMQAVKVMA